MGVGEKVFPGPLASPRSAWLAPEGLVGKPKPRKSWHVANAALAEVASQPCLKQCKEETFPVPWPAPSSAEFDLCAFYQEMLYP